MLEEELDSLIQEFDDLQGGIKTSPLKGNEEPDKYTKREEVEDNEELHLLLTDEDNVSPRQWKKEGKHSAKSSSSNVHKCSPPFITGTQTTNNILRCDKLHCLACDSSVICFEGFCWRETTDYIFLRTNYPNEQKLRAYLNSSRRHCAYACQCSQVSTSQDRPVSHYKHLKNWVCKSHRT